MDKKNILESLLFASGHPLSRNKISEVTEISERDIDKLVEELAAEYEQNNRGLRLIFFGDKIQMIAAPESKEAIQKLIKDDFNEDLSQAALETLAIIAYRGPISRAAIEDLRGVNCSFILQNLAIRGLIDRKNNPLDGRSFIYSITFDFLKHLGINKIEDLPKFEENERE